MITSVSRLLRRPRLSKARKCAKTRRGTKPAQADETGARDRVQPGCNEMRLKGEAGTGVPAARTVARWKASSSRTTSADRPGVREPVSAASPRRRAGVVLAAATTSAIGRPTLVIACRTTWSIVAVEPAIAPVLVRRATPPATVTSSFPSWYLPSGMPAAAIASVMRTRLPGPAARAARRTVTSCRWVPSVTTSQVTRWSTSSAPTGPGSRCPSGRMPLNRCVAWLTPAAIPAAVTSAEASVWPAAAMTPAAAAARITSSAPGSSGATVIIRSQPRAAACSLEKTATSGEIR